MTIAKITIAAMITVLASASFAGTSCQHKFSGGRDANTNPVVKTVQVVKNGTQGATR